MRASKQKFVSLGAERVDERTKHIQDVLSDLRIRIWERVCEHWQLKRGGGV